MQLNLRDIRKRIILLLITFEKTILYMLTFVILLVLALIFSGVELNLLNIALILSLNYEPKNEIEALALLFTFFLELSPIMAFVEVRTLSLEERAEKMAQIMNDHIIVVGCGHLGKRIINRLLRMNIPFCLIVLPRDKHENEMVIKLLRNGCPIIFGHAALDETLLRAGIKKARAIIIAMDNDSINMIIAEKAKNLNPQIKTVVRIYNDALANMAIKSGYADEVISTTAISVDTYIVGAFLDVLPELRSPIAIKVTEKAWFIGRNVKSIEEKTGVKILAIMRNNNWIRITNDTIIQLNDSLLIFGEPENLRKLIESIKFAK